MCTVQDAVADGVGDGGVGEVVVPALVFQLACDDRRAQAVAVLEDLQQVPPLGLGDGRDGEVVDDEDVDPGDARE